MTSLQPSAPDLGVDLDLAAPAPAPGANANATASAATASASVHIANAPSDLIAKQDAAPSEPTGASGRGQESGDKQQDRVGAGSASTGANTSDSGDDGDEGAHNQNDISNSMESLETNQERAPSALDMSGEQNGEGKVLTAPTASPITPAPLPDPSIPEAPPQPGFQNQMDGAPHLSQSMLPPSSLAGLLEIQNSMFAALQDPFGFVQSAPIDASLVGQLGPSPQFAERMTGDIDGMNPVAVYGEAEEDHGPAISAYAKLEFEDGHFFMTTPQLDIGRDQKGYRYAKRVEAEAQRIEVEGIKEPNTPVRSIKGSRYNKSLASDTSGIFHQNPELGDEEHGRRRRRKKSSKKSGSEESSSHAALKSEPGQQPQENFQYKAQNPKKRVAADVCPLLEIHPRGVGTSQDYSVISRKHLHIGYNAEKHGFEVTFTGRNGGFAADTFYAMGDTVPLESDMVLQIGGVQMRFVLPDMPAGELAADNISEDGGMNSTYSEGGKAMSFEFEENRREGAGGTSSDEEEIENWLEQDEEESDSEQSGVPSDHEVGLRDEEGNSNQDLYRAEQTGSEPQGALPSRSNASAPTVELEAAAHPNPPPKKRGPGRPPKDGHSSKREKKEAARAAKALLEESQNATKSGPVDLSAPEKNKVGRPRKHPKPDEPDGPREKRKYTKRKPKEPKEGEAQAEGSGEEGSAAKEKKEKKPPKPPRSPTPTFNEADLTPEQLAKPQANYVQLIHEALSNSEKKQLALPAIYRAIQRKYPYFVLKTNTQGWQSSVRHNLGQCSAFEKIERDGKGWVWGIVPGVSIEKERKKKASPPPFAVGHPQAIHPNYMMGHHYPPPGMISGYPPGYSPNFQQQHANLASGHPPNYIPPRDAQGNLLHQSYRHPAPNAHQPIPYGTSKFPMQVAAPGTYSSPYAPKPPTVSQEGPRNPQSLDQGPSGAPSTFQPVSTSQPPQSGQLNQTAHVSDQSSPGQSPKLTQPLQDTQIPQSSQPSQPPSMSQSSQPISHPQSAQSSHTVQPSPPTHAPAVAQATFLSHSNPQPFKSSTPSAHDIKYIENYKESIRGRFEGLAESAEKLAAIMDSAANQVLGITNHSTSGNDTLENIVIDHMRRALTTAQASNAASIPGYVSTNPIDSSLSSSQTQPTANKVDAQSSASQQAPKAATIENLDPIVSKASVNGTDRSSDNPIQQPPMMRSNTNSPNSGTPANAASLPRTPSSASAVPETTLDAVNGASTSNMAGGAASIDEGGQPTGQKRERSPDTGLDDVRSPKRITTSGPPHIKI